MPPKLELVLFVLPKIIHKNLSSGEPRTRAPRAAPEATLDLSKTKTVTSLQASVARTHVSAGDYRVLPGVCTGHTPPPSQLKPQNDLTVAFLQRLTP